MNAALSFHERAVFLRESSGSTNLERTVLKAVGVFHLLGIPHFVYGDFAVQEHGYPRFTVDVDIIVPDVAFAREKLALNGFAENPGSSMTVTDRETRVEVDLLPGGGKVDSGPLTLPMPTLASNRPQFLTLEKLISAKLSTYMARGIQRVQDYADVVQLISANQLSRDFGVEDGVRSSYQDLWDEIHQSRS